MGKSDECTEASPPAAPCSLGKSLWVNGWTCSTWMEPSGLAISQELTDFQRTTGIQKRIYLWQRPDPLQFLGTACSQGLWGVFLLVLSTPPLPACEGQMLDLHLHTRWQPPALWKWDTVLFYICGFAVRSFGYSQSTTVWKQPILLLTNRQEVNE